MVVLRLFYYVAEQLGGAMVQAEEQSPSPVPPALFRDVGPAVDDWETYLKNMADDMDKQHAGISSTSRRQEDNLFSKVDMTD